MLAGWRLSRPTRNTSHRAIWRPGWRACGASLAMPLTYGIEYCPMVVPIFFLTSSEFEVPVALRLT